MLKKHIQIVEKQKAKETTYLNVMDCKKHREQSNDDNLAESKGEQWRAEGKTRWRLPLHCCSQGCVDEVTEKKTPTKLHFTHCWGV